MRRILCLLFPALAGCSDTSPVPVPLAHAPPEITSASEEGGFVDLVLATRKVTFEASGKCSIEAAGVFEGEPVALAITLRGGQATYSSVGAESDALLAAMAKLYEVQNSKATFASSVTATVIPLDGDPKRLRTEPVKYKAFFNEADEEKYAELYTNVNLPAGTVELFEKDPEYRENIILALSSDL
jgi:hypothetical protein